MDLTEEAILVVEDGPNSGETIPLRGPTTAMGRHPGNDVVVAEAGVSRRHAEIVEANGEFSLTDLSTTNGTFVNGKTIGDGGHLLEDGDSIRLGGSKTSYGFRCPTANTLQLTLTHAAASESGQPDVSASATQPSPIVAAADHEDLYEGTVRLNVRAEGSMGLVVHFTQRLSERPEFRLLRLTSTRRGGVEVWLALRQPISLQKMLSAVEGVVDISPTKGRDLSPGSADAPLTIMLKAEDAQPEQ